MQQVHRKMEIGMFCNEYNLRTNDMTQNTMFLETLNSPNPYGILKNSLSGGRSLTVWGVGWREMENLTSVTCGHVVETLRNLE